jgi:invasion protein IalB
MPIIVELTGNLVTHSAKLLATSFFIVFGASAMAQTTPAPTPEAAPAQTQPVAPDLSMGTDTNAAPAAPTDRVNAAVGQTYISAVHGDWEERCVKTEDGADPCQLYQLLMDDNANPVAEISIFGLPKGQQAAAGATIIVPLETLLTESLSMKVDAGKERKYPFSWCSGIGCVSRVGFTGPEIDVFRKGNSAEISIVPVVAPDQRVTVKVSLKGFTAGFDAVNKANGN